MSNPQISARDPVVEIVKVLSDAALPVTSIFAGPRDSEMPVLGFVTATPDPFGAASVALVICSNGLLKRLRAYSDFPLLLGPIIIRKSYRIELGLTYIVVSIVPPRLKL